MIAGIQKELNNLENDRDIKILYAVESGSRAWGFASQDSDWDVRFIYAHKYDWYLSIQDHKDNIELMLPGDIDMAGWELRKALLLFRKSNPPLLEWLRSPMVYLEKHTTAERLRKSTADYFNPKSCLYHYFHMAKGNYAAYFKEDIVRLKKYLYVLRPILACCWIQRTMQMAPMEFDILVEREINSPILKTEIENLLTRKKNGEELDKGCRINIIDDFIEDKLLHFENYLTNFDAGKVPAYDELNNIFRSTLKEIWI